MKEKVVLCDLVSICQKDREIAFSNSNIGWAKKNGLDILAKFLILLANSFGKKTIINNTYIFVDEVKNSNMNNNLRQTKKEFLLHGEDTYHLCFYKLDPKNHIRIGTCATVFLFLRAVLFSLNVIFKALFGKHDVEKIVIYHVISLFGEYLFKITNERVVYMLMTDYNLYSSIIALDESKKSTVIQHGLQMDDLLCYPIRATHYFAWGLSTKQIMKDDPKILITGTYKYDNMKKKNFTADISTVLFCIGSLDYQAVKLKIDSVIRISKSKGYKCIIKCHPGSLYNSEYWKKLYKNEPVEIYKETLLQEIDFDLAVTESSTAIMDFISLGKPFILYDTKESYFGKYDNVLPRCESFESLYAIIAEIDNINFEKINEYLLDNELNTGICTIYETQKRMDRQYE